MRGVLTSITNIVGHARPRSPSISSSDSDVDDGGDDDLRPVGARIGHNFRKRPIYTTRFAFTYARATLDGGERAYEDIAAEQLRGTGVDPGVLVMRRSYWCGRERCMKFKYVCADWRTCGCPYYVYVNFGAKGQGTIEEPVNNTHNDHSRIASSSRVRATAQQKIVMDECIRDGLTPAKILSRLREKQLEAGLTLQYVQRYKSNHKAAVVRFEGFLGTVQEYEELLDEYAVEDNANENAAGIVHWEIITPADQPVKVRVIISSRKLLERLSTEIAPGVLGWCVDGTYKLNREGHVTVPVGVFDLHRKFYLCAFAILPGPGENEEDFEWLGTYLEKYLTAPGRETRNTRATLHLVSDSSAGLVSGLTKAMEGRRVESQRCWFHTKRDLEEQILKKLIDKDRHGEIVREITSIQSIPYPLVGFYTVAFDAWERRWRERETDVVQYVHSIWRNKHWSSCFSPPGFPTTNNGIESKNARIKEAFKREKMHLRDSFRLLAELIEKEVIDFSPEYNTTLPEMNRVDYVNVDKYLRNVINKDPLRRIEIDAERTLYPTSEFLAEIESVLKQETASDEERAKQREAIIRDRARVFIAFYDRTMVGGRPPAEHEPTHQFTVMLSLARAFHVVTKLPPSECSDTVLYQCTCVQTIKSRPDECSYGKHRKCKHVFAEGIKRSTLERQRGYILVHERVAPGRQARMPPALVRERPREVVNQYARWGLPSPDAA